MILLSCEFQEMELNMNKDKDDDIYRAIIIPRHSYSENNALRFINAFDKALLNKTDEFISCEYTNLKINSLKQSGNDALLWLTNNEVSGSKYKPKDYKELRLNIKLKPV